MPQTMEKKGGKFLVRAGFHNEDGQTYGTGEIVNSRCNLDRWPDKFQRLDDATGIPTDILKQMEEQKKRQAERESQVKNEMKAANERAETKASGKSGR